MTISTIPSTKPALAPNGAWTRAPRRLTRSRRGFTLVEVMIGGTLGSMILVGVLSTFLMLGRSGANASNYCAMEAQSRRALEEFSQDLRMARQVTWNSATSVTFSVPSAYNPATNVTTYVGVTYAYDSAYRTFSQTASGGTTRTLINHVTSFTYAGFDRANVATTMTSADTHTKRIRVTMVVQTTEKTVPGATNNILSASFILRNVSVN